MPKFSWVTAVAPKVWSGEFLRAFQLVYKVKIIFKIIRTLFWGGVSFTLILSGVYREVSRGYMMCDMATD